MVRKKRQNSSSEGKKRPKQDFSPQPSTSKEDLQSKPDLKGKAEAEVNSSDNNSSDSSESTYEYEKETGVEGRDFENVLLAQMVLYFTTNDQIRKFKFSMENTKFKPLDDMVFKIELTEKSQKTERIAMQLKYGENLKQLNLNSHFSPKNYKLALEKHKRYKMFMFTNRKYEYNNKNIVIDECELKIRKQENGASTIFKKNPIIKNDHCYAFEDVTDKNTIWTNLYLYTNQASNEELKDNIEETFQTKFNCQDLQLRKNISGKYLDFIKEYKAEKTVLKKKFLTKDQMQTEIAWCLLTPFVKPWIFVDKISERRKQFKEAVTKFLFTFLTERNFAKVKYMLSEGASKKEESWDKKNEIEKSKLLWSKFECPLATQYNEITRKAINLCKDLKFVLLCSEEPNNLSDVFKNLTDLKRKDPSIYKEIVKTFYCSLQGKEEIPLEKIIGGNEKIMNIITPNELAHMVEGPLLIGKNKSNDGTYIKMSLIRNIIENSFFNSYLEKQRLIIIIISDIKNLPAIKNQLDILSVINLQDFSNKKDLLEHLKKKDYIIFVTMDQCSEKDFQALCDDFPQYSCHHFKDVGDKRGLEWVRSDRNVDELKQFRKKGRHVNEMELKTENIINLVCADPGMGKSYLLKNMQKTRSPEFFTILIHAQDHSLFYEDENKNSDINEFQEYILNYTCKYYEYNDFDKRMAKIFMELGRTHYYWDGIDELSDTDLKIVKNIIKLFREKKCEQWITSRNTVKDDLENEFNVLASTIKQFDYNDQKEYFDKELKNSTGIYEEFRENVKEFSCRNIIEIPLHMFLLTEYIKEKNHEMTLYKYEYIPAHDLYKYYIEKKIEIYHREKCGNTLENSTARQQLKKDIEKTTKHYEKASLKLYFEEDIIRKWDAFVEIQNEEGPKGIVEPLVENGNSIKFVHNSFGEYFAASYLSHHIEKTKEIEDFIFDRRYVNIRFFLDLIRFDKRKVVAAILYKNCKLLESSGLCSDILKLACEWCTKYEYDDVEVEEKRYIIKTDPSPEREDERYIKILRSLLKNTDPSEVGKLLEDKKIFYTTKLKLFDLLPLLKLRIIRNFGDKILAYIFYYCIKFDFEDLDFDICDKTIYIKDSNHSMFFKAVLSNSIKIMTKMIANEAYKRRIQEDKSSLLWTACKNKYWKMAQLLVDYEIKIDIPPNDELFLHRFYKGGHNEIVELLIKQITDNETLNVKDKLGNALIHYACKDGKQEIVRLLIEYKADVHLRGNNDQTPIHFACIHNNIEIVEMLLKKQTDTNFSDEHGMRPIHYACKQGNEKMLSLLLDFGADKEVEDNKKKRPVHYACEINHSDSILTLIKSECNLDVTDRDGNRPIHYVCSFGNYEIFDHLFGKANMDVQDNKEKRPIHYSCENGCFDINDKLINSNNLNLNVVDKYGKLPIHYACEEGNYNIVKLLMGKKVNLNDKDVFGDMPLHRAFYRQHFDIVQLLLESGSLVNEPDKYGEWPIHRACKNGLSKLVTDLIKKSCKLNVENNFGKRPIHYACEEGHLGIVEILVNQEAEKVELDVIDGDGKTPLYRACQNGYEKIVKLLIRKKACPTFGEGKRKPIHIACERGHLEIVKILIRKGVLLNSPSFARGVRTERRNAILKLLFENGEKLSHATVECVP